MRKLTLPMLAILAVTLSGCVGPLVEVNDVSMMTPVAKEIPITDAPIASAKVLGEIEGYSCKNKVWDPAPSRAAADDQLRIKARALGANAIASVAYEKQGTTLMPNCWSSIRAHGVAVLTDGPAQTQ